MYKASPLAVFIKIFGAIVNAVLPIVTTYFAALTTTAHQVLSYLAVSGSDSRWRAISTAIVRL